MQINHDANCIQRLVQRAIKHIHMQEKINNDHSSSSSSDAIRFSSYSTQQPSSSLESVLDKRKHHVIVTIGSALFDGQVQKLVSELKGNNFKFIGVFHHALDPKMSSLLKLLDVDLVFSHPMALENGPDGPLAMAERIINKLNESFHVHVEEKTASTASHHQQQHFLIKEEDIKDQDDLECIQSIKDKCIYDQISKVLLSSVSYISVQEDLSLTISVNEYNSSTGSKTTHKVSIADAIHEARFLIHSSKQSVGIITGATVFVSKKYAEPSVIISQDSALEYSDTLLNEEWLTEHGISLGSLSLGQEKMNEDKYRGASVEDLQLPEAVYIPASCSIGEALDLMISREFSQLPVVNSKRRIQGFVTLGGLESLLDSSSKETSEINKRTPVKDVMYCFNTNKKYTLITPETPLRFLENFLNEHPAAFVTDASAKFPLAVVTKYDLLKFH